MSLIPVFAPKEFAFPELPNAVVAAPKPFEAPPNVVSAVEAPNPPRVLLAAVLEPNPVFAPNTLLFVEPKPVAVVKAELLPNPDGAADPNALELAPNIFVSLPNPAVVDG